MLSILAVRHEIDGPVVFLETPFDVLTNRRVVFDYEYAHGGRYYRRPRPRGFIKEGTGIHTTINKKGDRIVVATMV
jgi:hypothetical protein